MRRLRRGDANVVYPSRTRGHSFDDFTYTTIPRAMSSDMFVVNGEAAIVPRLDSPPHEVLEIAIIQYVGSVFIRLVDGRMFATIGGKCLNQPTGHFLVPANDDHREALKKK